jgi:hypothetical protein
MMMRHITAFAVCFSLSASYLPADDGGPVGRATTPAAPLPDMKMALSTFMSLADGHIASMVRELKEIAPTPEVQSGDWEQMKGPLAALKEHSVECAIWFARPDGSYFTVEKGLTDQNLKDRSYFPKIMAGETAAGTVVIGKTTNRKSVIAAAPILRGDKVIGAIGASIFLDALSRKLKEELALPRNMIFFALDEQGRTTLNHVPERVFLDPRDQGNESLTVATDEMLGQKEGAVEYDLDGVTRKVIFATSPLTGWRYAVGVIEE